MSESSNVSSSRDTARRHLDVPVPTVAEVHADRLRANLAYVRRLAGSAEVMAVVKADAYGHGIEHIVPVLVREGVDHFAVATVAEGVALREVGVTGEILVMGAVLPEALAAYDRYDLALALSSAEELHVLEPFVRRAASLDIHVNVDTGMGRLGLSVDEVPDVLARLDNLRGAQLRAVWSHFATADDAASSVVEQQWSHFKRLVRTLREDRELPALHVANSGALLNHRESLDIPCSMVRIGLALYGYTPNPAEIADDHLQPVMDVWSRVVHVKTVPAGTPVSYAHTWKAPRQTRIATLAAGYGDGYRRALSNRAQVRIRGSSYPIVGNVCMDMIMADVGCHDEVSGQQPVAVGDRALLFGARGPTARDLARWADTIPYEILCGISQRVPRIPGNEH